MARFSRVWIWAQHPRGLLRRVVRGREVGLARARSAASVRGPLPAAPRRGRAGEDAAEIDVSPAVRIGPRDCDNRFDRFEDGERSPNRPPIRPPAGLNVLHSMTPAIFATLPGDIVADGFPGELDDLALSTSTSAPIWIQENAPPRQTHVPYTAEIIDTGDGHKLIAVFPRRPLAEDIERRPREAPPEQSRHPPDGRIPPTRRRRDSPLRRSVRSGMTVTSSPPWRSSRRAWRQRVQSADRSIAIASNGSTRTLVSSAQVPNRTHRRCSRRYASRVNASGSTSHACPTPHAAYASSFGPRANAAVDGLKISLTQSGAIVACAARGTSGRRSRRQAARSGASD